jgi:hypothetical protein
MGIWFSIGFLEACIISLSFSDPRPATLLYCSGSQSLQAHISLDHDMAQYQMVQTGGLSVLRFPRPANIWTCSLNFIVVFWFRQIKYPKATITITPTTTPTPMPAFAPFPKPVLEEPEDGNDEDAAGVEAVVEAMVVDAMVAEVLVDEKAVEGENPGPTAPPIVVTLTKSPR